ncbi:MAG: electron transport complex subunit RsxC [Planctomycetota bacterium]
MPKTFTGGIHPPDRKELAKDKPIERLPAPPELILYLSQHIGAPAAAVVEKGDAVKKGQVIGEARGFVSAVIHSPVSGKVKAVEPRPHPLGQKAPAVIIENDGNDEWLDGANEERDTAGMAGGDIREEIRKAGIVGMGGATFPTHVKLSPMDGKPITDLVINCAECEPYLTCDYRQMLEQAGEIVGGLELLMKATAAPKGWIAVESNKPDAYEALEAAAAAAGEGAISVELLEVKYPQGAEHQITAALLGREIPSGGLPIDIGVICQNTATAVAVNDAIRFNKPLIERALTVTGEGVENPANYLVPLGTPLGEILGRAGLKDGANKLIIGGPMMGLAQYTSDVAVTKGTSGILALTGADAYEPEACIRCGRCVEVCPWRLVPSYLSIICEARNIDAIKASDIMDCKECGCCTYVCPSRRPIVHLVKYGKAELMRLRAEEKAKKKDTAA